MQTSQKSLIRSSYSFILIFVAIKLCLNAFAAPHFGLHRDELLHLTLGDHLGWGYKEVPPLIGLLAKISISVFGTSVAAARVFPTMSACLIIWLTGLLVMEFGGKRFAIALACLCLIFSPAFAASNYLFQPVVFDQLWWVLSAWLSVKYVNTGKVPYLYLLGAIVGLGMLTKYSMAFFSVALLFGMLLTPQRWLVLNKNLVFAILLTSIIFLPNVIWQYLHHWPVITHMHKLKAEQLDNVKPRDFIIQQFLVFGFACLMWIAGLLALLFNKRLQHFRFIALAYLLVFAFLLLMEGKPYYLFGAYPMLFAAGGCAFEWLINTRRAYALRATVLLLFIVPNLLLLPVVLPVLSINQTLGFFKYMQQHMHALNFATTWEDQKQHQTTQDYADMLGWEEMSRKTAEVYHCLTPEQQKRTVIFADNYGEAGALHYYHKKYNMPDAVCLNSSFALWAPMTLTADYMIYISDDNDVSDLKNDAEKYERMGGVDDKLAREYGTGIFLISHLKPSLNKIYQQHLQEELSK